MLLFEFGGLEDDVEEPVVVVVEEVDVDDAGVVGGGVVGGVVGGVGVSGGVVGGVVGGGMGGGSWGGGSVDGGVSGGGSVDGGVCSGGCVDGGVGGAASSGVGARSVKEPFPGGTSSTHVRPAVRRTSSPAASTYLVIASFDCFDQRAGMR